MARVKIGNVRTSIDYLKQYFAPAGYGLGELGNNPRVSTASEVDSIKRTGWAAYYNKDQVDLIEGAPNSHGCSIYTEMHEWNYGRQTAWTLDGGFLTRAYRAGVWQPWEWHNPPMYPWDEYRTTELWSGKPVYTRLVKAGVFPESGAINVEIDIGATAIVRFNASIGCVSLPIAGSMEINTHLVNDKFNIQLKTIGERLYDGEVYVTLYYIKD